MPCSILITHLQILRLQQLRCPPILPITVSTVKSEREDGRRRNERARTQIYNRGESLVARRLAMRYKVRAVKRDVIAVLRKVATMYVALACSIA